LAVVTMKNLLESGVHFGHQVKRWDPRMKKYIFAERNGIHIIDLQKTIQSIKDAYEAVRRTVAGGKTVLFVGTKKQAQQAIQKEAERCGMYYVNNRWLGGMLTNFQTVRKSIKQIDKIDDMENQGVFKQMSKKEVLDKNRERSKLLTVFGGIREMSQLPGVIVITDLNHEHIAVSEARRLRIPIIGICDTNVNPELVQYPIPANDDALSSVSLLVDYLAANTVPRQSQPTANTKEKAADKEEKA